MKNLSIGIVVAVALTTAFCAYNNQTSRPQSSKNSTVYSIEQKNNIYQDSKTNETIRLVARKASKVQEENITNLELLHRNLVLMEEQGGRQMLGRYYYELACLYLDSMQYKDAIQYFLDAEVHGYEVNQSFYFQLARAYALEGTQLGTVEDYLLKARKAGFRNYRALLYDKAFKSLRAEGSFIDTYTALFENNKKAMFKLFLQQAPQKAFKRAQVVNVELLFENSSYAFRKKNGYYQNHPTIPYQFSAFIDGLDEEIFSRSGGDDFRFEQVVRNNEYVAVIYSREDSWSEFILPKQYHLVTFDYKGNKIASLKLGSKGRKSSAKGFAFYPDNRLQVFDYKIKWKKGVQHQAMQEGRLLGNKDLESSSIVQTTYYSINSKGQIVIQNAPLLSMQ